MKRNFILAGVTRYWWLLLLTGLICLGFGVWSICAPAQALPILAVVFAIGLLAVGLFDGIWGFATSNYNPGWGWDVCMAVIDIVAGIWMLTMPAQEMTLTFLYIVGIWLIFAAFSGIGMMFSVSYYNPFATFLAVLLLLATLVFSFWLIISPIGLGVMAWMWVGIALCCYGVYRISLAFKVRNLRRR
ncbi:MAG: DUF308 domain-containing protein [Muribaculaceae bacterium]|nr:DUF308 domain-containing protein [Muribaculaceae bacterium]MDE5923887.1 DUF308 domain-containing protein [Muribaculaceae bacterium]MDE6329940.1 DUF308 domain-containing protein [Muribaculaceae bacterium]